jgi:SpoVK/Ycf46/Vps4 family AAA+-type ATPase
LRHGRTLQLSLPVPATSTMQCPRLPIHPPTTHPLPQVVNGPEVLSKYVGQAEENIRNLFAEAESEYKEKAENSVRA